MKHGYPRRQQSQNMAKIFKSYILTLSDPQGHMMSVIESIDEPTDQVWLLYHHPNFKYCTLFASGTELRTDKQTDNPITRCPRRTFQAGGIKRHSFLIFSMFPTKTLSKILWGKLLIQHPRSNQHLTTYDLLITAYVICKTAELLVDHGSWRINSSVYQLFLWHIRHFQ